MSERVLVLGVGGDGPAGLAPTYRQRVAEADLLCGGRRLLALWPDFRGQVLAVEDGLAPLLDRLRQRGDARVVVLASGDPGFYGIGGTLARELPADQLEIVPHVTSLQLAFARAGLPWNDAVLTSAHARPLSEVVGWARRARTLGILTDPTHTPAVIASALLAAGVPDCRAIVAEDLELPTERVLDTRLSLLPGLKFAPLNVLILAHGEEWRPAPVFAPRPDQCYRHRRGLITKADVRALCLARLALSEDALAWDIGAGSGAVSIEMAQIAWRGRVWAVEQDAENLEHIAANRVRHGALNLEIVSGRAPDALADLPSPDAVFVGGSDGELPAILRHVAAVARPGCRIVLSLATLESLAEARATLADLGLQPEVAQVSIAHGQPIAGRTRLAPLNPVFIVSATVPWSEYVPGEGM